MASAASPARKPVLVRCAICGAINRVDLARLDQKPKCARCRKPLALDRPQKVTDADFQKIIDGASVPVVVDYYADWCGPCHAMAPILDDFALERAGDVLVLKLDTDANPETARRFGIRGIPTLVSFRGGRELRRHVGVADRKVLEGLVT
ncbi:MAG: thioredoxin [Gemmatimonadales bacterium]